MSLPLHPFVLYFPTSLRFELSELSDNTHTRWRAGLMIPEHFIFFWGALAFGSVEEKRREEQLPTMMIIISENSKHFLLLFHDVCM